MTLATRIIPALLCRDRQLVKGEKFQGSRRVGVVTQAMQIYQAREVDELVLIDIGATPENRTIDPALVAEVSASLFTPLTAAGGITTVDQARALLANGADKIGLGFSMWNNPVLAAQLSEKVGSQAVVALLDHDQHGAVMIEQGKTVRASHVAQLAKVCQSMGVGEIVVTDCQREGTMIGYNLEVLKRVVEAVDIPVIAHGGCGSYNDMLQAVLAGASGVAVGSLFQFTDATPKGAAEYLHEQGVETRQGGAND